jgi:hypothetical protein
VEMQGLKGRLKEEKQDGIKKDSQIDRLLEMVDEKKKDREKEMKGLRCEAEKSKRREDVKEVTETLVCGVEKKERDNNVEKLKGELHELMTWRKDVEQRQLAENQQDNENQAQWRKEFVSVQDKMKDMTKEMKEAKQKRRKRKKTQEKKNSKQRVEKGLR